MRGLQPQREMNMIHVSEMQMDIRQKNLERKKFNCLMCDRLFHTTRGNRVCGKCHKLIDNRYYESNDDMGANI